MHALPSSSSLRPQRAPVAARGPRGYSAEVTVEAVTRMMRLLRGAAPLMMLLPAPVAAVFWHIIPRAWLVAWWIAATSITAMQFSMTRAFLARPSNLQRAVKFGRVSTFLSLLEGINWGLAGLFMLPEAETLGQQLLLLGLIIGIPSGAIFGCAFWPATQYVHVIAAIGLTAVGLALHGASGSIGLVAALLIYVPIVIVLTEQAHRIAIESIRLHFENADLVKRLEAEKQVAERANIAKSRFLAAASHDLRQPLHSLGLFVAALNEHVRDEQTRPIVANINSSLGALQGLFNALLDISRLDAGAVEVERRDFPLAPLLERLASEYQPQAKAKGLAWHIAGTALAVKSDAALLETILRNLISNALRYTERGEIAIDCHAQANTTRIEVRDTGIGIAPEHQQDIFREFHQLHNPERDRSKGLGLGLAIVHRLAKLLGHELTLRSTLGQGSSFTLSLPSGNAAVGTMDAAPPEEASADAPLHVLVIDDETDVRTAMGVLLGDWGHEVIAAGSLDEAQRMLQRAPDAIVADYRLRDEQTGVEAIRSIQARFGAAIPALIITGDTLPERIAQANASGFALLHKPVAPAKLRAFIRMASRGRTPFAESR